MSRLLGNPTPHVELGDQSTHPARGKPHVTKVKFNINI